MTGEAPTPEVSQNDIEADAGRRSTAAPTPTSPAESDDERRATGMAVVAAGTAFLGFVSFFRLTGGWDDTQARAFRRLLGVMVESVAGISLGLLSLNRLRDDDVDRRGLPFAAVAVVLGASNLVRARSWLRGNRRGR